MIMKTKNLYKRPYSSLLPLTLLISIVALWLIFQMQPTPVQAAQSLNEISVTTSADNLTPNDGQCTLREAIINANNDDQSGSTDCAAGSDADTITFAGNDTITLGSQLPTITADLTIIGNGNANTIIQASTCDPTDSVSTCTHNYRVLEIAAGTVLLKDLTIRHGRLLGVLNGAGIAVDNESTDLQIELTLDNVLVTQNYTDQYGGGIMVYDYADTINNLTLQNDSAVEGNTGLGGGAGIYFYGIGTLLMDSSSVSNNVGGYGAGILAEIWNGGNVALRNDSRVDGNQAIASNPSHGGGITLDNAAAILTIDNSSVSGNTTNGDGGGIYSAYNITITISNNSRIQNNQADSNGGGIYYQLGSVTVTDSTFSGNDAIGGGGGAIFNYGATLTVTNSTYASNTAANGDGGAIVNEDVTTITNSTFYNNSATGSGGAIHNDSGYTLNLTNSTFSGNNVTGASSVGSAVYNGGIFHLKNTILADSLSGADCYNGSGDTIDTNINNLIETNGASGHMCGTPASTADPLLGSLADNGGSTQTMLLLSGSPAIGTGDNATCAASPVNNLDQRGVTRPQGANCDIGAVEAQNFTLTVALAGNGAGTVSGLGIACAGDCTESYHETTLVTLTASADTGSTFMGWSGACSGTGACVVTMDAAKAVTAVFNASYELYLPIVIKP